MKSIALVVLAATFMLASCVVAPVTPDYGVEVAPPLPTVIELGVEPYYYQGGFYYFYEGDRWQYSRSRSGPWRELPRSHWPREIRRGGGGHREGGFEHEHEREREREHEER